jgi:AraC-like DNA-binding protein
MNDYLLAIYTIIIFQSLFLTVVFLVKKTHRLPNRILGILVFTIGLPFIGGFMDTLTTTSSNISFSRVTIPLLYAYGPLIQYYTRSLIGEIEVFNFRQLRAGIPFLIVAFFVIATGLPGLSSSAINSLMPGTSLPLADYLLIQSGLLYLITIIVRLRKPLFRYKKSLVDYFSNVRAMELSWLRNLLTMLIVTSTVHLVVNFADIVLMSKGDKILASLESVAVSFGFFSILLIAWTTLTKPNLFDRLDDFTHHIDQGPQYSKQRLDVVTETGLLTELENHMDMNKPYLAENLTLNDLAGQTGIPPHQITMVLNLHRKQNYYSFINSYRIKEACRRLSNSKDDATILTIAMDSGFKSKSTFNTLFKKTTGLTPREFRRKFLTNTTKSF